MKKCNMGHMHAEEKMMKHEMKEMKKEHKKKHKKEK
jgi:hypothetical protein